MAAWFSWPPTRMTARSPISILSRTGTSTACSVRPRQPGGGSRRGFMTPWRRQPASRESKSLFTEASELARRLFERKGFAVVERQDMVIRGVAIHNYRMAKALD